MSRLPGVLPCLLGLLCCLSLACSAPIARIPVQATLAGTRLNTTVDSDIARYYLEHYLAHEKVNPAMDTVLDQLHQRAKDTPPDRDSLKYLSKTFSVDFAALYLTTQLLQDEANNRLQSAFSAEVASLRSGAFSFHPDAAAYMILFAPGWFYKTEPTTGADFARQRAILTQMGIENHLLETAEDGAIEHNATLLAQEIRRYSHRGKNMIVVSASKAGPEVAQALGELLDAGQTQAVKAWVNIGGLLRGSALADATLHWPKSCVARLVFLVKGWDFTSVESMTTERSQARFRRLRLPAHLFVLNYVGIPLSGTVTVSARDRYIALRREGPNDGLTLLTDAMVPASATVVEPGLDHFFLDPDIDVKTVALTQVIIRRLATQQHNAG